MMCEVRRCEETAEHSVALASEFRLPGKDTIALSFNVRLCSSHHDEMMHGQDRHGGYSISTEEGHEAEVLFDE